MKTEIISDPNPAVVSAPENPGAVMAFGAIWASAMRWSVKFIGLFSTLVLARLLAPEDFGIITKAIIILGLTEMLSESGFVHALVRMPSPTPDRYQTVFTLNVLLATFASIATALTAYPASVLLSQPELLHILPLLAIKVFVLGWENPRIIDYRRTFNFKKDFIYQITSKSVIVPITIAWAFYFKDYHALVFGQICAAIVSVSMSYLFVRFRPKFTLKNYKEFLGFTAAYIASEYAEFLIRRIDVILLSLLISATGLGLYNFSAEIAALLTAELIAPAARAFYPVFSSVRDDPEKIKKYYLQSMSFTFPVSVAVGCGLFSVAYELLVTIGGVKWGEGATIFAFLGAGGAASVFSALNLTVLTANGNVKKRAKLLSLNFIALCCALLPVAYFTRSSDLVAITRASVAFVFLLINFLVVASCLNMPYRSIFAHAYRPAIAGACMIFGLYEIKPFLFQSYALSLASQVAIGALIYISTVFILWRLAGKPEGSEQIMYDRLKKIKDKRFPPHHVSD